MVLAGIGIGGLAFGGSVLGLDFLPVGIVVALIVDRRGIDLAYVLHARRAPFPILDLKLLESRRSEPPWSVASSFGPGSAPCRSCCRCCCSLAST